MIKKVLNFIKRLILSAFILYGYNVLATPLGIIIPINFITLGFMTVLGVPSLFAFIIIHVLIF